MAQLERKCRGARWIVGRVAVLTRPKTTTDSVRDCRPVPDQTGRRPGRPVRDPGSVHGRTDCRKRRPDCPGPDCPDPDCPAGPGFPDPDLPADRPDPDSD